MARFSILSSIVASISLSLESDQQLYVDLPGRRASESPLSTIPVNIVSTASRPDIVLCNGNNIKFLELTICSNTPEGFNSARVRKQ